MSETPPELTLTHLQNVLRIIEITTQRGTFKPEELQGVGSTYNSIKNFVDNQIAKIKKSSDEEKSSEDNVNNTVNNSDSVKEV